MTKTANTSQKLLAQNTALVLVNHQVGLMTGVRDYSPNELKHNVVGLAKAAEILGMMTALQMRSVTPDAAT